MIKHARRNCVGLVADVPAAQMEVCRRDRRRREAKQVGLV